MQTGRISKRSLRIITGGISSTVSRAIVTVCHFVLIGILSRTLSHEELGVWLLFANIQMYVSFLDFGIGGGALRNALASLNKAQAKNTFFFAFFLALCFFGVLVSIYSMLYNKIPWNHFFHIRDLSFEKSLPSICFFVIALMVMRIPFSFSATGFYAYQQIHIKAMIDALEQILALVFITVATINKFSFVRLALLYYSLLLLFSIAGFFYFLKKHSWKFCISDLFHMPWVSYRKIATSNLLFWLQNFFSLLLFSSLPFMTQIFTQDIAQSEDVALRLRLYQLLLGVQLVFLNAIWSGYSDAIYKQDIPWIRKTFRYSTKATLRIAPAALLVLFWISPYIIKVWCNINIQNDFLGLLLTLWTFIYLLSNVFSVFLNAQNCILPQVISLALGVVILVVSYLTLPSLEKSWVVVGISIVSIIPFLVTNSHTAKHLMRAFLCEKERKKKTLLL